MSGAVRLATAVVLAGALLGAGVPAAERAHETRTATRLDETATRLTGLAERLAARNDPTLRGAARRTVTLRVPSGGTLRIEANALRWRVDGGPWHVRRPSERFDVPGGALRLPPGRHHVELSLRTRGGREVVDVTRTATG